MASKGIRFGALPANSVHICVDMQRMFAEATQWQTPWMERVLPNVIRVVERRPSHTLFTRFIPAGREGDGAGTWRRYYRRWRDMTIERIGEEMVQLVPELARYAPPAKTLDKAVYSPWIDSRLHEELQGSLIDTLILTGGETDVCVLATALGAVDLGYRTVMATDAICSSSDATHEALMQLYNTRFNLQIETATTDEILDAWC